MEFSAVLLSNAADAAKAVEIARTMAISADKNFFILISPFNFLNIFETL